MKISSKIPSVDVVKKKTSSKDNNKVRSCVTKEMCNNIGVRGVSNTTNIIGNKKIKVNMQRAESEIKFARMLFKSDSLLLKSCLLISKISMVKYHLKFLMFWDTLSERENVMGKLFIGIPAC